MKAEIVFILDRSGSMASAINDYIGGFNRFLEDQKSVPGECDVTLVQFDTEYLKVYEGKPIAGVEPLTLKTFVPRGGTALFDAICRTIDHVGLRLSAKGEADRPEKVIVVILTDGEENSSKEFALRHVKDRISHQRDAYKWEFIFLAANQDAFAAGGSMGISQHLTQNYAANSVGIAHGYTSTSQTVRSLRTK